jgi:EAL domain-containing protein (putative c-di-GMP-specific phosphodiesterase class I)
MLFLLYNSSTVNSMLLEGGLPARLELEITEGVLINESSRALSTLRRLKTLSVTIAIDDFNTGYSTLSSLQSFPFDKTKIERTFISGVNNQQPAAIVRAVTGLSKAIHMPVIAAGVETDSKRRFLMHGGFPEIQGYLFGRPKPIANYVDLASGVAASKVADEIEHA